MSDDTIDLDKRRGMAAQKETRLRRLHAEVREQPDALRARQDALEEQLVAAPAESWEEAAEKARRLLNLFAANMEAQDPRRQKLIAAVLNGFPASLRRAVAGAAEPRFFDQQVRTRQPRGSPRRQSARLPRRRRTA